MGRLKETGEKGMMHGDWKENEMVEREWDEKGEKR